MNNAQLKRDLTIAIDGVDGWLHPAEAWVLHELARRDIAAMDPTVVEIGSWKGRSAIAIALGLRARGRGRLIAIDPHPDAENLASMIGNLEAAGIRDLVEVMHTTSHLARPHVGSPVDLLLIDGSHDYEDVLEDIDDWTTALAPGAVVVFDDPYMEGVNRALLDRVALRRSPYRNARWIVNKLVFDFGPDSPWRARDEIRRYRLRALLLLGVRYMARHWRLEQSAKASMRSTERLHRIATWVFHLVLPSIEVPTVG